MGLGFPIAMLAGLICIIIFWLLGKSVIPSGDEFL